MSAWMAHLEGKCGVTCHYCEGEVGMEGAKKNTTVPEPLPEDPKSATYKFTDRGDGQFQTVVYLHPGELDPASPSHNVALLVKAFLEKHFQSLSKEEVGIVGVTDAPSLIEAAWSSARAEEDRLH